MHSYPLSSVISAIAFLYLFAQPIAAQVYSNTTTTASAIAPAPTNGTGITNAPGWKYDGCQYDAAHFTDFALVRGDAPMTVEICTGLCANTKYAALLGSNCYCGNNLAASTTPFLDASCNLRCPGSPSENCGGDLLTTRSMSHKRDIVGAIVVSLYEQVVPPAGIVYTTVIVATYLTICLTGATLSPTATTATLTLTHCGCTNPTTPTIPMTTLTTTCGCGPAGGPSTVVLTVPATRVPTAVGTAVVAKPSVTPFKGGAGRIEVAAGVVIGAAGVAAVLL